MFENYPKCRIFQKLAKLTIFGIFNELLPTQNVNVARSARNFECDLFCDFQTLKYSGKKCQFFQTESKQKEQHSHREVSLRPSTFRPLFQA